MYCIYCDHPHTAVISTRKSKKTKRRRRQCLGCGKKFSTVEQEVKTPREYNNMLKKLHSIDKFMQDMKNWIEDNS